jgi:hypothetical protein
MISVKQIEKNQFEVVTSKEGFERMDILTRETFPLKSMKRDMAIYHAEDPEFSDVWGNSFELRKEICAKIEELVDASYSSGCLNSF